MRITTLRAPSPLVFGPGALDHLGSIASQYGDRSLLVTEGVLHDGDHVNRVRDALKEAGLDTMVFDELMPTSATTAVDDLASLARASKVPLVVGLGGMRVLSIARCVANVSAIDGSVMDMLDGRVPEASRAYIEIPASFRNHLLMRDEAVLRSPRDGRAVLVRTCPGTVRAAVVDTAFSETLSSQYAVAATVDTLMAAIEGFVSTESTLLSDALLETAVGELYRAAISGAQSPGDPRFRARAAEAALLASQGIAVAGQGAGGALAYVLNARLSLPKSWVAAILLPHIADMLIERAPEKMARVAAAFGEPVSGIVASDDAPRAARAIRRLMSRTDLPIRLRDLDVTLDDLAPVVEESLEFAYVRTVPDGISPETLEFIVSSAY